MFHTYLGITYTCSLKWEGNRAHIVCEVDCRLVFRRGHSVLKIALPPKEEYVLLIKMSTIQRSLYREFMNTISDHNLKQWATSNPLKAFAVCCKVLRWLRVNIYTPVVIVVAE